MSGNKDRSISLVSNSTFICRRNALAIGREYEKIPTVMLELLRAWWREGRRRSLLLPGGWLFPGRDPVEPLSARQPSGADPVKGPASESRR
jgi:hypothetical protein